MIPLAIALPLIPVGAWLIIFAFAVVFSLIDPPSDYYGRSYGRRAAVQDAFRFSTGRGMVVRDTWGNEVKR